MNKEKIGYVLSDGSTYESMLLTVVTSVDALDKQVVRLLRSLNKDGRKWYVYRRELNPVMWDNCLYSGRAVGHSYGFCTADSCY